MRHVLFAAVGALRLSPFFWMLLLACTPRISAPQQVAGHAVFEFWLVTNEPPLQYVPNVNDVDRFVKRWRDEGILLPQLDDKGSIDSAQAAEIMGQRAILEALGAFRGRTLDFPRVRVQFFSWDQYLSALGAARVGSSPDLIQIPSSWCSTLASEGLLSALPSEVTRRAPDLYVNQALISCRLNEGEKLYGIPWLMDVRLLFAWRDVIDLGREIAPSPDHFRQALDHVVSRHIIPFAFPINRDWELLHLFTLVAAGESRDLFERHGFLLDYYSPKVDEAASRGFARLLPLIRNGQIALQALGRSELEQEFLHHNVGALISGPWMINQLRASLGRGWDEKVSVSLPPFNSFLPPSFIGGSLLGITTAAGRRGLSADVLRLAQYLSTDASLGYARAVGLPPAARDAFGSMNVTGASSECRTYFTCLAQESSDPRTLQAISDAVRFGRAYPPSGRWVRLELSTLTSLYHFWHDLAAERGLPQAVNASGGIGPVLADDIAAVTADWTDALTPLPFWIVPAIAGGVLVFLLMAAVILVLRLRRNSLLRQLQILEQSDRRSRSAYLRLQATVRDAFGIGEADKSELQADVKLLGDQLDELRRQVIGETQRRAESLRNPVKYASRMFQEVKESVSPLCKTIVLATRSRAISVDGQELTGQPGLLLEHLLRRSLLDRGPVEFSLISATLHTTSIEAPLPEDGRRAFATLVTKVRKRVSKRILPLGHDDVYRLEFREEDFLVYVDAPDGRSLYTDAVRKPLSLAPRAFETGDLHSAMREIMRAWEASRALLWTDAQVLILFCKIANLIVRSGRLSGDPENRAAIIAALDGVLPRTADDPELACAVRQVIAVAGSRAAHSGLLDSRQTTALKEVRAELGRLRARCTAFLALYPNVDAFCRSAHMDDQQPGSALQGLWDEIPKLAREIEEALGDEPTPNALPEEIRAACEELLGSVRLTGGAPLDPGFEQKLNSIVEYCQRELLPGLAEPFLVKTRDVLEADAAEGRRLMHHIRDFVIRDSVTALIAAGTPPTLDALFLEVNARLGRGFAAASQREKTLLVGIAIRDVAPDRRPAFLDEVRRLPVPGNGIAAIEALGRLRTIFAGTETEDFTPAAP